MQLALFIFIHVQIGTVIEGLTPRFKLLLHDGAQSHTFEKWRLLESKPLFESKKFRPKLGIKNGLL